MFLHFMQNHHQIRDMTDRKQAGSCLPSTHHHTCISLNEETGLCSGEGQRAVTMLEDYHKIQTEET